MQQRCALFEGFCGVAHGWQDFVLHLNQLQGFLGDVGTRRRHRGNGVSLIQHLIRRHDVVAQEAHIVDDAFGEIDDPAGGLDQIRRGNHGMDPRDFLSVSGVDRFNARMRVGTAQDLAIEHAR